MLEELRAEIDAIDDKITALYLERLKVVARVAEEKKKSGGMIFDPERERKILARLTSGVSDELKPFIKEVYSSVFATAKAYERTLTK